MLVSAYNSSAYESDNSAQNELNSYLESIEAKVAQFQNRLQELEKDLISSDLIKFFVDFGTSVVSVIDKVINQFGLLSPLITTVVGVLSAKKNIGRVKRNPSFEYAYNNRVPYSENKVYILSFVKYTIESRAE